MLAWLKKKKNPKRVFTERFQFLAKLAGMAMSVFQSVISSNTFVLAEISQQLLDVLRFTMPFLAVALSEIHRYFVQVFMFPTV